jgi:adenylosuccinate lyase
MIERYTLPEMGRIWSDEARFGKWLEIEILAVEAWSELGEVPEGAVKAIRERAAFDPERIREIEEVTRHDVIAFLTNLAENVGEESRYIHYGLTSSDVLDTGLALQMRDAADLIIAEARGLTRTLKSRALEFRDTVMIGRTHGVHAEPTTFGHKLALWAFEMRRDLDRLERAREVVSYGKLSGAVGTYGNIDPRVESYVCERLGLRPAEVSTQVLQRDRHAEYMAALALTGATCEKIATEIRALQRTDILEAEEPFGKGQKGSSAMPHKRNPIICERISGMARLLRGNALAALENVNLWHERDISHSSVERVIIPDSTMILYYMLKKLHEVITGMRVYPQRMMENLERTGGLVHSERVLLALVGKGLTREEAYALVQRNAMRCWETGRPLVELLAEDAEVSALLGRDELEGCFELGHSLRNLSVVFERLEKLEV